MGGILDICKKSKNQKKTELKKEEKAYIFEYSKQGQKKNKEEVGQDVWDIINTELGPNIKYFAVYDGHGARGKEAALYAQELIRAELISEKKTIAKLRDKEKAMTIFKKIYNSVQSKFKKKPQEYENSGTCAISVLLIENHCFVINLGDSRAVLGSRGQNGQIKHQKFAYQMSIDHKANKEDEKKRIELMGGIVSNEKNGPHRIFSKTEDGPGLAVARTLGDLLGHSIGVSCEPEITYKLLDNDDKFMVIGSDGIWDVMNSAEVIGFVFEKGETINKEKLPETLVIEARNRWEVINMYKQKLSAERLNHKENNNTNNPIMKPSHIIYSIDDITAVVCFFNTNYNNNAEKENNNNNENNENESVKSDDEKRK